MQIEMSRSRINIKRTENMRMPGVEPGSQAWEACMMPLHYMRLDGSEFLRGPAAGTHHLVRGSVAQEKSTRQPGRGGATGCMFSPFSGMVAIPFAGKGQHPQNKTTPVGFEPTRGDPIGLAGRRLNRSAKVSSVKPKAAMTLLRHFVLQCTMERQGG